MQGLTKGTTKEMTKRSLCKTPIISSSGYITSIAASRINLNTAVVKRISHGPAFHNGKSVPLLGAVIQQEVMQQPL